MYKIFEKEVTIKRDRTYALILNDKMNLYTNNEEQNIKVTYEKSGDVELINIKKRE